MLSSLLLRGLFVLAMASPRLCDAARVGQLDVRNGNGGVPCFTISEAEEKLGGAPNFHSITVGQAAPGAKVAMWRMSLQGPRTFPVSFRMCVPYAGRLPVLPQTPAAQLLPGQVYDVAIEARGPFQPGAPRSYRARFCVSEPGKGVIEVRSTRSEGRARQVCSR